MRVALLAEVEPVRRAGSQECIYASAQRYRGLRVMIGKDDWFGIKLDAATIEELSRH